MSARPLTGSRWRFLLEDLGAVKQRIVCEATDELSAEHAQIVGHLLSDDLRKRVLIVAPGKREPNPSLAAHTDKPARWHITSDNGEPLADLYFGIQAEAGKLARLLANMRRERVRIYDNATRPKHLSAHPGAGAWSPNPNPKRRNPGTLHHDGTVHMTRAEYAKVHRDYRGRYSGPRSGAMKGKLNILTLDPKTGFTVLVPVTITDAPRRRNPGDYVPVAQAAKELRAALKRHFPTVKFSVRSKSYSGGASITVSYENGPRSSDVDRIAQRFSGADFDGMTDLKTSHDTLLVGADGAMRSVRYGSDYVFVNRHVSPTLQGAVIAQLGATWSPSQWATMPDYEKERMAWRGVSAISIPDNEPEATTARRAVEAFFTHPGGVPNPSRSPAARERRRDKRLKTLAPRRLYRAQAAGRRDKAGRFLSDTIRRGMAHTASPAELSYRNPRGGPRIVYNRLLGGWYVVVGPHQTPITGRFDSKAEAQAWLGRRSPNPTAQSNIELAALKLWQLTRHAGISAYQLRSVYKTYAINSQLDRTKVLVLLETMRRATGPQSNPKRRNPSVGGGLFRLNNGAIVLAHAQDPNSAAHWLIQSQAEKYLHSGKVNSREFVLYKPAGGRMIYLQYVGPRVWGGKLIENPSYRLSGTIEEVPDAAPVVRRRPGRPRKVAVVPVAPPAGEVPFEIPGKVAARRDLQPGEHVTVPYSGLDSYFGRRTSRTREHGTVEGYHDRDGQRVVQVTVRRGRSVETHFFPERDVRRRPRSGARILTLHRPQIKARLERKVRGNLANAEALLVKLRAKYDAAEAVAREWYGFKPKWGETNKQFTNARAKMRRLEDQITVLEGIRLDLGGESAALPEVQTGTDPWATNRRRNPSWPAIDHTLLSPSGRVSKRARDAAMKREAARLFPPGYWDPAVPTPAEKAEAQATALLRTAAQLRDLAARGVQPRKYVRAAEGFERQAAALRRTPNRRGRNGALDGPRTVRGVTRKGNPRGSERQRAVKTFRMWHEFDPHRVTMMKGPDRLIPRTLVKLGDIRAIDYISDKYEGRPVTYTHRTDRPRPVLATDPDGRHLHIVGGRVKITADGLVH